MTKTKTDQVSMPVAQPLGPEVIAFRELSEDRRSLDELVREGARKMLQEAIKVEVDSFIDPHQDRQDDQGRRLIVRNEALPARQIMTGTGPIEVRQG